MTRIIAKTLEWKNTIIVMDLYKKQKKPKALYRKTGPVTSPVTLLKTRGGNYMSLKRIALGKEALEKLKTAQNYIAEAYTILIESGLLPRNAKSICKNYINDSFENKE